MNTPIHKWFFSIALVLLLPLGSSSIVLAAEDMGFEKYPNIVDTAFMEEHATIPPRDDVMIVDSRPRSRKYDKGHLPGAISIPDREFDQHVATLPEDKNTLLVFYCGGLKCSLSHKSAFKAEALGYTNIKVYAEGYPAWLESGQAGAVSTAYMKKLVDGGETMIVDARPKARKYDKGHIPGAINIPFREFDELTDRLPADKATPLVFYCGGFKCTLSVKSANKAMALGYTNVRTYPAGMPAWTKAYGDDTGAKAGNVPLKAGNEEGTISIDSFNKAMHEAPDSLLVVDVRDPGEYARASFKTAINIPIDDLENRIGELPADKPIVFVCNSGGLAGEAYDIVKMVREELTTFFLDAEVNFNKDGSFTVTPIGG